MSSTLPLQDTRRYDVDWLRNLAFMLLILYHVGMYYVFDWGWHIKSEQQSELLQNFMIWSNQWRMSLLFFVSGMTLALISAKYSATRLIKTRFMRLFIPLVFGMLVIVPPQLYWELVYGGTFEGGYLAFYAEYLNLNTDLAPHKRTPLGLMTWNHLWYLAYLWHYTLVFLCIKPVLNWLISSALFKRFGVPGLVVFGFASLLLAFLFLRQRFEVTHALVDDWYSHAKYFSVMICGYLFVNLKSFWQWVIDKRLLLLTVGCITIGFVTLDRNGAFPWMGEAFRENLWVRALYGCALVTNLWCWLLTMVGFAGRYLNRSNAFLRYANQAVLPWYMLHQTLIILFAVWLAAFNLSAWVEAPALIALTLAGCVLGYELVKRVNIFRLLFGIKINHSPGLSSQNNTDYTGQPVGK